MTLTAAMRELAERMTKGPWKAYGMNIRFPPYGERHRVAQALIAYKSSAELHANEQAIALADLVPRLVMALEDAVDADGGITVENANWNARARALLTEIAQRLEQKP